MSRLFILFAIFVLNASSCERGEETENNDIPDVAETLAEEVSLLPPEIVINIPGPNQIIKTPAFQVIAQLNDPENKGISEIFWRIDEAAPESVKLEPAQHQYTFDKSVDISKASDGIRSFQIKAVTSDGRTGYASQPIFVDRTAPMIEIKSPPAGGYFIGDMNLELTITDGSGTGLNQILVKASDNIVKEYSLTLGNISADGKYKETISQKELPVGIFTLKIFASDKAGHTSEVSRNTTRVPAPDFIIGKGYSLASGNYTPISIMSASLQEGENALLLLTSNGIFKLTHHEVKTLKEEKLTSSGVFAAKTAKINPSDAFIDLVTAQLSGTGNSKVVVYLQNSNKVFVEVLSKEVSAIIKDFIVTDINADTFQDVVAITNKEDKTLVVLLGSKTGLKDPVYYGGVANAYSMAAGFFHQEGILDIAVGKEGSDSISIFKGSVDGEFKLASNIFVGSNARKLHAGEFEASTGFTDLAVLAEGDSALMVMKGEGGGGFSVMDTLATGEKPNDFIFDDIDSDGNVDFVVMSGMTSLLAPFYGDPTGKFVKRNWLNAGGVGATSLASVDINSDGLNDFAVLNPTKKIITIFYGKGDRKFHGAQEIRIHPGGGESGALEPHCIAAARFTGKQTDDLAVLVRGYVFAAGSKPASAIVLYVSDGFLPDGYHWMNKVSMFRLREPTTIQAADINNDKKIDLVVGSNDSPEYYPDDPDKIQEPSIELLLNLDNNGAFTISKSFYAGKQPSHVLLADIFKSYPDIITVSKAESDSQYEIVFCFNKDNTPGEFMPCEFKGWFVGKKPSGIFAGKVNFPPGLEVLVSNFESNDLTYYPGGYATLVEKDVKFFAVGTSPVGVQVADLDKDTYNDIITPLLDDITISYGIDNNDNFETPVYLGSKGKQHTDLIVVDINKDGLKDIITTNLQSNTISIYVNLGERSFAGPYDFAVGQGPGKVISSDFNSDGCPDLAVMNRSGKTVTLLVSALCE